MRLLDDHPIAILAGRRRNLQRPPALPVLLAFGLAFAVFCWRFGRAEAVWALGWCASLVGFLVLVAFAQADSSFLVALKRGRCLDELMDSPLQQREVVDVTAVCGIPAALRAVFPLGLLLLAALPLATTTGQAVFFLLWLPLAALLYPFLGYCGISAQLHAEGRIEYALALPLVAVAWYGGIFPMLGTLALFTVLIRRQSLSAVQRGENTKTDTLPLRLGYGNDPIVRRESLRSGLPVLDLLVGAALAVVALALADAGSAVDHTLVYQLCALAVLLFLGSAFTTSPAVVRERQQGTWETLIQTGWVAGGWAEGWVRFAMGRRLPELVVVVPSLAWMVVVHPTVLTTRAQAPLVGLLLALLLPVAAWAGAWCGLVLSALSGTPREARGPLTTSVAVTFVGCLMAQGDALHSSHLTAQVLSLLLLALAAALVAQLRLPGLLTVEKRPERPAGHPYARTIWMATLPGAGMIGLEVAQLQRNPFLTASFATALAGLLWVVWRPALACLERGPWRLGPLLVGPILGVMVGSLASLTLTTGTRVLATADFLSRPFDPENSPAFLLSMGWLPPVGCGFLALTACLLDLAFPRSFSSTPRLDLRASFGTALRRAALLLVGLTLAALPFAWKVARAAVSEPLDPGLVRLLETQIATAEREARAPDNGYLCLLEGGRGVEAALAAPRFIVPYHPEPIAPAVWRELRPVLGVGLGAEHEDWLIRLTNRYLAAGCGDRYGLVLLALQSLGGRPVPWKALQAIPLSRADLLKAADRRAGLVYMALDDPILREARGVPRPLLRAELRRYLNLYWRTRPAYLQGGDVRAVETHPVTAAWGSNLEKAVQLVKNARAGVPVPEQAEDVDLPKSEQCE